MWPWNKLERDLVQLEKRVVELDRREESSSRDLELKILELERNIIQLAEKTRSEVIELNNTTEVLSDRYLSWEKRLPEIYEAFVQINEKMETIEFFQPVRIPLRHRATLALYNHRVLLSAIGCGLLAVAGLFLLFLHNM